MPITPRDLKGISTHRLDVLKHNHDGHIIRFQTQLARPFIRTGRARAVLPEIPDGIDGFMAIAPRNPQDALLQPFHIGGFEYDLSHRQHRSLHQTPQA